MQYRTTSYEEGVFDTYWFEKNLQGDIIAIVDKDAQTVARYSYDAWGAPTITQDTSKIGIANINPFRYREYFYDIETSFYYVSSRYYAPEIDRFINSDQANYLGAGGSNLAFSLFVYCSNNPIIFVDSTGKWAQKLAGFRWRNNGKAFTLSTSVKFLSRAYCLAFATDIMRLKGKWRWKPIGFHFSGLSITQIAAECFVHALLYYLSEITIALLDRGYNWNLSGKEIDVDKGDYRQNQFTAIWVAFSVIKRIPWVKLIICSIFGYTVWVLM